MLVVALVVGVGVVTQLGNPRTLAGRPSAHSSRRTTRRLRLNPPGPIPGYLLIADRGNNRMLLVDSAKRIYWRYPKQGVRPAMGFYFDDDTFFGPKADRIISNQEDQDTLQIISFPGGRVLWRYGHVNVKGSAAGYLNTPDDAYLLPSGLVTVADAYNCRVLFIAPAQHRVVRQYGTSQSCRHNPPAELGAVNGATPLPDGGMLVSEIPGNWIDDISHNGVLRWAVQAPVSYPSDPQLLSRNRILLADYASPGHVLIMTRTGHVLWRYGPTSGPGELNHPSLALQIAPGLIAINDDYRDRVVLVSIRTKQIVWQYGHTDVAGTAPGYLNTPDGLDLLPTAVAQSLPQVRAMLAPTRSSHNHGASAQSSSAAVRVGAASFSLPAPVQREIALPWRGGIVIAGGLGANGQSSSGVFFLTTPHSGRLTQLGAVPEAFHDAAGAILADRLYVFGGGSSASSSAVQQFNLTSHTARVVAQLPRPLSDLAAAKVGNTVYLIGGYDDHSPQREIYRTSNGTQFTLAAELPVGLRYPAVATIGTNIIIAGGNNTSGPTTAIYRYNTTTGKITLLGRLPQPLAHATAIALRGAIYVLGGIDAQGQTLGQVLKINPATGTVTVAATVEPIADSAAASTGTTALFLGGERNGQATARVTALQP